MTHLGASHRLVWSLAGALAVLATLSGSASSAHPAQHGCAWRSIVLPNLGDDVGLSDVDVVAEDDVWIVGSRGDPSRSLLLHYDGSEVEVVDSPSPFRFSSTLRALSASGHDDVWAVGSGVVQVKPNSRYVPFALHFDGTAWRHVSPPRIHSKFGGSLGSVAALSPNDVWAFGSAERNGDRGGLAARWNGKRWRTVPVPGSGSVAAATTHGPASVWVATADFQVFHWNGRRWLEASPGPITNASGGLSGISALTDKDVWVVGAYAAGPLAGHFDGRTLRKLPVPYAHFRGNYEAREDSYMGTCSPSRETTSSRCATSGSSSTTGNGGGSCIPPSRFRRSTRSRATTSGQSVRGTSSESDGRGVVRHYSCP